MFQHCFKMVFTLKVTITMIQASMFQIKQLQKITTVSITPSRGCLPGDESHLCMMLRTIIVIKPTVQPKVTIVITET